MSQQQKEAIGKAIDLTAQSWEKRFEIAVNEAFEKDKRELLVILGEERRRMERAKASVNWLTVKEMLLRYLRGEAPANWREMLIPMIRGVIESQGRHLASTFGFQFDVTNVFSLNSFLDYVATFAQKIVKTTNDGIVTMLAQATNEGWSIRRMERRMGRMFEEWQTGTTDPEEWEWYEGRKPQYRRESIARTETMRASNFGAQAIYEESGVESREWLATMDHRTRPSHEEANGQVKPIKEPFLVGGFLMMFPGDASLGAPPEEYINCRCTPIPVIGEEVAVLVPRVGV